MINNWDDYKRAIVEDIMKQDREIVIHYEGDTEFPSSNSINNQIKSLYLDARENIRGTVEDKNISGVEWKYDYIQQGGKFDFSRVTHTMTYKNSANDMKEVQDIVDNFFHENITSSMSDYEKVRTIYDFVIGELQYGYTGDTLKERNMLLGLQGQKVVCEAYAMLFAKMVTDLGYNNMIISGKAGGDGHAWNLIEIDGQWYHVDPTWGDDEDISEQDKYFLTSDEVIKNKDSSVNSRTWDESYYPKAPEVYQENHWIDKEIEELKTRTHDLNNQLKESKEEIKTSKNLKELESVKSLILELGLKLERLEESLNSLRSRVEEDFHDKITEVNILLEKSKDVYSDAMDIIGEQVSILLAEIEEAVNLAEISNNQEDVNNARSLVEQLHEGENKDTLNSRLNLVQNNIILSIKEDIEDLNNVEDVDEIEKRIISLPDGERKAQLEEQLQAKVKELNNESLLQTAIEAVKNARENMIQEAIDTAMELVKQLEEGEGKDNLLLELSNLQEKLDNEDEDTDNEDEDSDNEDEDTDNEDEDEPGIETETKEEEKDEEAIMQENSKTSKEVINELNTILKIVPNMNAKITVRDVEIKPDVKPYIYKEKEEKILVPIRFVAEALGFEVNWSKTTWNNGIKKVFLSYEGKGIVMEIGKDMAYLNGKPIEMDIAPELRNGRTYISLNFIVEILETSLNYSNVDNCIFFHIL